jgi:electron transfer flavoprotein beta subunit
MNILVLLKMVPDVVEELGVAADEKSLDTEFLRLIVNERDDHALEQALLLKERHGATVTVLALEAPEIDEMLFTALAKGVDRAVKITGVGEGLTTGSAVALLTRMLPELADAYPAELVLTGCYSIDDLDAMAAPLLAHNLDLPFVGIVAGVEIDADANRARVFKEFPGGTRGEYEIPLPAVIGIQAAEKVPRYVPVAKVRAAMKTKQIAEVPAAGEPGGIHVEILKMEKPEAAGRAEMLEGEPEEVAGKICDLLAERGLL